MHQGESLDNYFVFAGKIYRRQEPSSIFSWRSLARTSHTTLVLLVIVPIVAVVGLLSARISFIKEAETRILNQLQLRSKKRKLIYNQGSSLADLSLVTRASVNYELNGDGAIGAQNLAETSGVKDELKELSSALRSLAMQTSSSSSTVPQIKSEEDFDAHRISLIRTRDPREFLAAFRNFQKRMGQPKERNHPLKWKFVQESNDILLLRAAGAVGAEKASSVSKCGRCGEISNAVGPLTQKKKHALKELSSRLHLESDLEKVILFAARSRERPEEIFDDENCLRIVEPIQAQWSDIAGKDYQECLALSTSFDSVRVHPLPVWPNVDTLVRQLESSLARKGDLQSVLTCGVIDSSSKPRKVYGFFPGTKLTRYDCLVDPAEERIYFNNETCTEAVLRGALLSTVAGTRSPEQKSIVRFASNRETTFRTLLGLEDDFSEVYSFALPSKAKRMIGQDVKEWHKLADSLKKQAKLPSNATIGFCSFDSVCGSKQQEKSLLSRNDLMVICFSNLELDDSSITAFAFVKDRALCGCLIRKAVEATFAASN